jgi:phosphatidylglycerol:prolipoprotein diacylglycerol transferase
MTGAAEWWSHIPGRLDPYLIEIGSFRLGYYGLMYLAAFAACYVLALYRLKREKFDYTRAMMEDSIVWAVLGLIVGARLGYVLFYNIGYYAAHPLEIILPFEFDGGLRYTGISGMSYHGGAIGVATATYLFLRKRGIGFWRYVDFFIPVIPFGYMFGRLGNFINGELYGKVTDVPWGMYFPSDPSGMLRHPSQLYEAFFEGMVLIAILWSLRKRKTFKGFFMSVYLIGYGTVRFFIEFVREPDAHLGYVLGPFSLGQVLCFIMILLGVAIIVVNGRGSEREEAA